jgi:Flp pilus assembly protein TadD
MMGQTDLARAALQKAAGATNDFPVKEESKRRLALLQSGTGASSELSLSQLEAMVKEQPNDVVSQIRLGEAYEKQGVSDKAAAAFEQAVKLNPRLETVLSKLALLYAGPLQNKDKALVYAKKARELAPGDSQVTATLARIAYQNGNFAWAYSLLQEAARQRENDPEILHDLGWTAYNLGKTSEAREMMQKAMATGVNFPDAADTKRFLSLTALDENPKELMTAEKDIQNELQTNPQYLPALMAQAALDLQRGQIKPATEIYTDILQRSPDFAPAQKHLATLYAQQPSTTAAAYDLATKARKTLPDDTQLTELLGRLSYEKKDYQRAIQLLKESASKGTLSANSLFYLGMSQLQTKQKDQARDVLNQALVDGLQEPLASEARQVLAGLQPE